MLDKVEILAVGSEQLSKDETNSTILGKLISELWDREETW